MAFQHQRDGEDRHDERLRQELLGFALLVVGPAQAQRIARGQIRLGLLDVLDEYINTLLKYKGLMLSGSYEKLKEELGKANDIGRILKG